MQRELQVEDMIMDETTPDIELQKFLCDTEKEKLDSEEMLNFDSKCMWLRVNSSTYLTMLAGQTEMVVSMSKRRCVSRERSNNVEANG